MTVGQERVRPTPHPHHLHTLPPPQGVIHRDIKPENLLCISASDTIELRLADFGLAIDSRKERAVTRLGTLDFMVRCGMSGLGCNWRRVQPCMRVGRLPWIKSLWAGGAAMMQTHPHLQADGGGCACARTCGLA